METIRFRDELIRSVSPWLELSPRTIEVLKNHYQLLLKWNRTVNLTKLTGVEEAVQRHYAESLFLGTVAPAVPATLADLGSGAGFPGIPLAAMWPSCKVTLVESDTRKAAFLRECRDLLPNLLVECVRAEHLIGQFDVVVGRAVRPADIVRVGRRCSRSVGLLLSPADLGKVKLASLVATQVPGAGKGIAVWGDVPRETA